MHWAGSLFLCLCGILLLVWFLPLRIHFTLEYQERWKAVLTVSVLWLSRTYSLPGNHSAQIGGAEPEKPDKMDRLNRTVKTDRLKRPSRKKLPEYFRARLQDRLERTSFQIHWHRTAHLAAGYIKIMARHLRLEQYQVRCRVGFSRPDVTAYSYGLFWAAMSAMPQTWLRNGTVTWLPDFQQNRQEVYADGIIYCRVGQIIRIMISLFRLSAAAMPEQNDSAETRKEQIAYES